MVFPLPGGPQKIIEPGDPTLDCVAQGFARPQQVLLPNKLVQSGRTHAGGQGTGFSPSRKQRCLPL